MIYREETAGIILNPASPHEFKLPKTPRGFYFQVYLLFHSLILLWHSKTLKNYDNAILDNKSKMLFFIIKVTYLEIQNIDTPL